MSLDEKIASFLARADTKPAASKLEPYAELIRTLRQRRWTYQQIAAALRGEFTLSVAPSTIHAFVKVRARASRAGAPKIPVQPAENAPMIPVKMPRFQIDA